jgi:hypothetical protein
MCGENIIFLGVTIVGCRDRSFCAAVSVHIIYLFYILLVSVNSNPVDNEADVQQEASKSTSELVDNSSLEDSFDDFNEEEYSSADEGDEEDSDDQKEGDDDESSEDEDDESSEEGDDDDDDDDESSQEDDDDASSQEDKDGQNSNDGEANIVNGTATN